jgi:hypothetical protein
MVVGKLECRLPSSWVDAKLEYKCVQSESRWEQSYVTP